MATLLGVASIFHSASAQTGTLLDNHAGYSAVAVEATIRTELGAFTNISNTIFRPKGEGPHPAVVIVHTCGGLQNEHIRGHAKEILEAGYVVLVQDSHSPRGFQTCRERQIPFAVGLMDAYAGLNHLATQSFVDANRIFLSGFSYGGFVAMLAASPRSAVTFQSRNRFRATVAHYANCVRPSGAKTLLDDVDRPLLMLFGAKDNETPLQTCFPVVEQLLAAGKPVSWHTYPEASHAWDQQGEGRKGYVFDKAATQDATRRVQDFFSQYK
jgi:dienelactone hydrolase